jgi:hypothetical protein
MALTSLKVAGFENQQQGYLVLEEPIPPEALDPSISQKVETLHVVLDGGGKTLQDGAHAFGYSHQGGQILAAVAYSEETGPAAVVEVVGYGVLSLAGSRAEANCALWNLLTVPPRSIIEVRQVSTQCKAIRIDLWVVVLSAGILP